MNKISVKVAIIYFFLALFNISFFTVIIFENQIDLIAENTKFKANDIADKIYRSTQVYIDDINSRTISENKAVEEIRQLLEKQLDDFVIFEDSGEVIFQTSDTVKIGDENINDAMRSYANQEFMGELYYSRIDEENSEILFYRPLELKWFNNPVLMFKLDMYSMDNSLKKMYRLILVIIAIITLFHIVFALLLNIFIVNPINILHKKSLEISRGNLQARIHVNRTDEIGQLGDAFNQMASSVEKHIKLIEDKNDQMLLELDVAGQVQKAIYPVVQPNEHFEVAVYHKPLEIVSGDYHDIFTINDKKSGFLVADVSGHGVPAALITMKVKDLFNRFIRQFNDPKDLFCKINSELRDLMDRFNSYFTAFYVEIEDNVVRFISAGHGDSYILKNNGEIIPINTSGFIIGVSEDMNSMFISDSCTVDKGEKIVLFTDGIYEAKNAKGELFDTDRFMKALSSNYQEKPETIVKNVLQTLDQFTAKIEASDDRTLMIIEIK